MCGDVTGMRVMPYVMLWTCAGPSCILLWLPWQPNCAGCEWAAAVST